MTTIHKFFLAMLLLAVNIPVIAQDDAGMQTLFNGRSGAPSGGYGAITNKFTTIDGEYANMVEVYGGWFIHKKLLLGVGGGAVTNNLPVPYEHRVRQDVKTSYEYGQVGLMTEYVLSSNKAIHLSFSLLTGAGFTLQYERYGWDNDEDFHKNSHDTNWFFVAEPGVQVEFNLVRWMRFCPGISYRFTQGADGRGLDDGDLRGASMGLTMKFGKF